MKKPAKKGEPLKWLLRHATFRGRKCLIWPFARNQEGYGHVQFYGKVKKANRVMCIVAHGLAPSGHVTAHSCGNGHLGCVNPNHLSWKTLSENEQDKKVHGTVGKPRGNRTNLTPAQIAEIRASKGIIRGDIFGKKFGLTRAGVRYWQGTTHEPKPPGMSTSAIRRRQLQAAL